MGQVAIFNKTIVDKRAITSATVEAQSEASLLEKQETFAALENANTLFCVSRTNYENAKTKLLNAITLSNLAKDKFERKKPLLIQNEVNIATSKASVEQAEIIVIDITKTAASLIVIAASARAVVNASLQQAPISREEGLRLASKSLIEAEEVLALAEKEVTLLRLVAVENNRIV